MSKFSEFREYVLSLPPDSRVAAPTHSWRVYTFPDVSPEAYIRLNNFPDDPAFTIMYDGQAEDFDDLNVYMGINDTLEMPRMSSNLGEGFGKGHEKFTNVCSLATRPLRWKVTDSEIVVVAEVGGKAAYLCGGEYFEGHILSRCYDGAAIELSECPPGIEKWSFSGMLEKLFGPPF